MSLIQYLKWEELYDLTKEPTKRLMNWRDSCYACGGFYDPVNGGQGPGIPLDAILAELNTREHIPNKQEAKAIRQQKAQQGKKAPKKKKQRKNDSNDRNGGSVESGRDQRNPSESPTGEDASIGGSPTTDSGNDSAPVEDRDHE